MKASRTALFGAAAALALIGTAAAGFAQSPASQPDHVIEVPPGAVVLVLPPGSVPTAFSDGPMVATGLGLPAMPSPAAMFQQIDRRMDEVMASMQRNFANPAWLDPNRMIEAAMHDMAQPGGHMAGVVVTSFSNGHGTCAQRVIYSGDGAAPVVQQVASTGSGCAGAGLPSAAPVPAVQPQDRAAPHLIQVRNQAHPPSAPLTYAMSGQ